MRRISRKALLFSSAMMLVAVSAAAQERNAYFGETHVHTGWSFDAFIFGNTKSTPADAYRYAKGETIKHPLGYDIKIETPLDWMGVTDHSEYVGTVALANTPGSAISKLPIAQKLIVRDPADITRIYLWLGGTIIDKKPIEELISPQVAGSVWKQNIDIANEANEPGKFTAFCSYEWTSTPNNRNMHRNVFFRDCAKVPEAPYSSIDSSDPSDLWNWMDGQRKAGNELLAISHNANLSDGHMFPTDVNEKGRPIDAAWAASRDRNERLSEIKQIKGASETHPTLSPNDEFANFEILTYLLGDPAGRFPTVPGSYIRQALKDGLSMMEARGYNPYKTGFVGGSDSHNTGVPYRQDNFYGGHARNDGDIKQRMSGYVFAGLDVRLENPAGLTGVWAEENTRASLFDAMQRKETFATSGPHIQVRFFGGPNTANVANQPDWIKAAYASGVPMGGDLPPLGEAKAPSFVVWAVKDPTSGNLDRIQIVKGWSKHGQSFEKVFDVAWAGNRTPDPFSGIVPPIGSTVNIADASYTNTIGSVELKGTWTDPEFDPSLDAFYYLRTLEIPTPRWTTIQAKELGIAPPDNVAATIQERAWSSPIWYTPTQELRAAVTNGTTVADLKQQGATALDDAALTDLVVGKSSWVRNNVTGEIFNIAWTTSGQRLVSNVNGAIPKPSEIGDVLHGGLTGSGTAYAIKDGAIVTTLNNAPYEATVYKLGDKYYAARSNEFGYANYEVVPTPQMLDPLTEHKSPF
ncbi:DUF3604 domain-containing protein [Rhizobiaceae bacterium n13]|uniref:DUF3604 domain-containing protein n=1 Tax=Ferirhizobium litorale TaxID=2927786 RepID=A0AAE3QFH4_9HYPH|nr:DUF3604 domain-containing protein [Fererhizobium litorale]MDI7863504.1 DUF3604 domain-containing protein [Fererhizobium litorale]MDI7922219.1 DUF3604 domain-containing protein [Fererhizobium litorale]